MLEIEEKIASDVLVAGTGLAGLRAARTLAEKGLRVLLISRGKFCSGSSFYPLTAGLGSQLYDTEEDKEVFLREVLETGLGVADEKLCRLLIEETPAVVEKQPELGMHPYSSVTNRPACFAKRERRLRSWGGWDQIRREAGVNFAEYENLTILQFCDLLRVVTKDGQVAGALVCDHDDRLLYVQVPVVILATGGTCGMYKHSLNTADTCGSGHSVALDAGASLINMEFLQFIPGFTKPVYQLLFSETTLRRCSSVKNADGEEILRKYLPEGVSFRDCMEDRAMHGPFTCNDRSKYFEIAMMDDARKHRRECGFAIQFDPGIAGDDNGYIRSARKVYGGYGIDLAKDIIWLGSFAHCANGGILADENARTAVRGLYAAGEAMGGIHGADRHGGMATAAALVFGERAAQDAARYIEGLTERPEVFSDTAAMELAGWLDTKGSGALRPEEVMLTVAEEMWYEANAIRDEKGLAALLGKVMEMQETYNALARIRSGGSVRESLKAFHTLRTAEAMLRTMLERTESRGPHYRADFPAADPAWQGKRILVTEGKDTGILKVSVI